MKKSELRKRADALKQERDELLRRIATLQGERNAANAHVERVERELVEAREFAARNRAHNAWALDHARGYVNPATIVRVLSRHHTSCRDEKIDSVIEAIAVDIFSEDFDAGAEYIRTVVFKKSAAIFRRRREQHSHSGHEGEGES